MVAAIQSYNGASGMHLSHIELKVHNNSHNSACVIVPTFQFLPIPKARQIQLHLSEQVQVLWRECVFLFNFKFVQFKVFFTGGAVYN